MTLDFGEFSVFLPLRQRDLENFTHITVAELFRGQLGYGVIRKKTMRERDDSIAKQDQEEKIVDGVSYHQFPRSKSA